MMASSGPSNVHISSHPCVHAKISQLRAKDSNAREVKALVHEIALIIGTEVLGRCLKTTEAGTAETPLGYEYSKIETTPSIALVPILRSGLGMLDAIQMLLPHPVPVHHLGLFREITTLSPVEYYNNLPYHKPSDASESAVPEIAIILDPVIATGGTSTAAIQTLQEWGVGKVVLISLIASEEGLKQAATESGTSAVEVWVGAVDKELDPKGMIKPGLGDIGDRLFLTVGK